MDIQLEELYPQSSSNFNLVVVTVIPNEKTLVVVTIIPYETIFIVKV